MSISRFNLMGIQRSLIQASFLGRQKKRRRPARLEVSQLEDRALLSTALAPRSGHDSFVTASSRVNESSSAVPAASPTDQTLPSVPLLARLGYYVTTNTTGIARFVPHFVAVNQLRSSQSQALDAKLASPKTDVYVLVHGFAPGYQDWVDNYAAATGQILDWWQTIPANYAEGKDDPAYKQVLKYAPTNKNGDTNAPVSAWLLGGHSGGDVSGQPQIVESRQGMAWDLAHLPDSNKINPHAVVLAYSWLDGAATSGALDPTYGIPTQGYLSEAATELNGERLAAALEQLTGGSLKGSLQLIGHSHGSKVATVAAVALEESPTNPIHVNQLTLLDSPETGQSGIGYGLASYGDANDDWYFLPDLTISCNNADTKQTTFVDNYWSLLGQPFNNDSYNSELKNVIDVKLNPNQYQKLPDYAWKHSYAAYWYAGSSEKALTNAYRVGRAWSALSAKPSTPAAMSLAQDWLNSKNKNYPVQKQQFRLKSSSSFAVSPDISGVTLVPPTGPTQTTVTLNGQDPTQSFTFKSADTFYGLRGLLFDYQFKDFSPGDELTISINGKLAFEMQPYLIQPQQQPSTPEYETELQKGTISMADTEPTTYAITFALSNANGPVSSKSSVTVSSINQYGFDLF